VTVADAVVVGGGLVGTALAYELACADPLSRVVLVEAGEPGRASDAGAGIISPQTFREADEAWATFGLTAAAHLQTLVGRLIDDGVEVGPDAISRCGSLVVALAEHEDGWFEEAAQVIAARNAGAVHEVTAAEASALFPPLKTVWRALHNPAAMRVNGRQLRAAVHTAALSRGVQFVNAPVTDIERVGDRVVAVQLGEDDDAESLSCGAVVLATGAWSAAWGEKLDARLPVVPMKGQIVHVTLPSSSPFLAGASGESSAWPIVSPILNFYLVPWPGGRVACGGTFEDVGYDTRPTAAGLRDLLRECVTIAPGLAEATFTEVRVGLRPVSSDDRPILGPLSGWSNVHVCTGHGAEGLLMGPYSAALVAAAMTGTIPPELAPYGPARFGSGGGSPG
jgi:D-amino-acid dehydrogenase